MFEIQSGADKSAQIADGGLTSHVVPAMLDKLEAPNLFALEKQDSVSDPLRIEILPREIPFAVRPAIDAVFSPDEIASKEFQILLRMLDSHEQITQKHPVDIRFIVGQMASLAPEIFTDESCRQLTDEIEKNLCFIMHDKLMHCAHFYSDDYLKFVDERFLTIKCRREIGELKNRICSGFFTNPENTFEPGIVLDAALHGYMQAKCNFSKIAVFSLIMVMPSVTLLGYQMATEASEFLPVLSAGLLALGIGGAIAYRIIGTDDYNALPKSVRSFTNRAFQELLKIADQAGLKVETLSAGPEKYVASLSS